MPVRKNDGKEKWRERIHAVGKVKMSMDRRANELFEIVSLDLLTGGKSSFAPHPTPVPAERTQ